MPLHPECLLSKKEEEVRKGIRNKLIETMLILKMKLTEGQADVISDNIFLSVKYTKGVTIE